MTPVNVWLVAGGYLPSPDRRPARVLCHLERIGRDMVRFGVRVSWCDLPGGVPALTHWRQRHIYLAPWLFDCEADVLRDVILHELAHAIVGRGSCWLARQWQTWWYRDVLEPMMRAA